MANINLLPWRQTQRTLRKRQFFLLLGSAIFVGLVCCITIHSFIQSKITIQERANTVLQKEIDRLNIRVIRIKQLQKKKAEMITRLKIIHKLQTDRPLVVRFFDDMTKIIPSGVYLTEIKRVGEEITVTGEAESNTRVSQLMRNIEESPWLSNPVLLEITTDDEGNEHINDFKVQFKLSSTDVDQTEEDMEREARNKYSVKPKAVSNESDIRDVEDTKAKIQELAKKFEKTND